MLILHHILKTAGTALKENINRSFPPDREISALGNEDEWIGVNRLLRSINEADLKKFQIGFGHYAYKLRYFFPDALEGSIFRHPIKRWISQYHYENFLSEALNIEKSTRIPYHACKSDSEFFSRLLAEVGDNGNLQSRTLLHNFDLDPNQLSNSNIDKCLNQLSFVGVSEYLNTSVEIMNKKFDFNLGITKEISPSPKFETPNYLPRSFLSECEEKFEYDFYLYEKVLKRFEEDYQALIINQENYWET